MQNKTKGLVILVSGGRTFYDRPYVFQILNFINCKYGIKVIIQGGATGADKAASDWAEYAKVINLVCPAHWDDLVSSGAVIKTNKYGKQYRANAGFERNQRMLDEGKPDWVICFPGGNGTADMYHRALKAKSEGKLKRLIKL